MKQPFSIPIGFAFALALILTIVSLGGCRAEKPNIGGAPADSAQPPGRKILYWKSQMVPGYRSDKPGKDPVGMDLMPVYEGEAPTGPPGSVTFSPQTVQQIGVKTVVIRRQALNRDLRTIGRIDYDEELVRDVAPKIGGWVEKQYVNFPGQLVRRGEPLGEIYSPELVSTEQEYLNALQYQGKLKNSPLEDATAGAQSLVQAVETRLRYWDITDAQIRALRERGKITRTMVLHTPFTGIVAKKNVFEGGYVNPGESMYRLADISRVWVYGDIYEYEAPWLELGQQATMTLAYAPGVTYHGRVIYVYPYLKEKTRTLEVRMEFRNDRSFDLKPGMWADVNLKPGVAQDALVIPVEAVLQTGKRNVAILALGNGHFLPREIKLGAQAGDYFEVLSGLQEGDRVVNSAEFLINSESALQSALNKMTWQPESAGAAPVPSPGTTAGHKGTEMPGMEMPAPRRPSKIGKRVTPDA
ncbi:MAG TPA: efflux RND transporter periplasmic adaptor subunit [Xanthobacteraceae bacterium]|nr:efflux RND transporter periplasmic adaptor subunit [Xanthobacteraceae bacterium]